MMKPSGSLWRAMAMDVWSPMAMLEEDVSG